jgi:hypothetical protein
LQRGATPPEDRPANDASRSRDRLADAGRQGAGRIQ